MDDQSIRARTSAEIAELLGEQLTDRHYSKGYIAFIKKQGRDSHGMNASSPHIATFHAGYDDAQAQYKSWHRARIAMSQEAV